ncbi:MAG: glucose 1-dehydrogenase [Chthonomonadales bacterium]|nr:glucose 1-dehydrogenase [Chthonomonadales bacterium]
MHAGFDIGGRVAVVTGGTSGLGRGIAEGLAAAGAIVVAGSRDAGRVADARAALRTLGPANDARVLDVTDAAAVRALFEGVAAERGRVDILVNAAGVTHRAPAVEMALEDWERVLRVNLTGTFLCCQAAARAMREQDGGGAIVNIASLASHVGLPWVAAYGASKGAVAELTQALAVEWAPLAIRVNAIAPGVFPTPLNRPLIEGTPRGAWFLHHTPMRRFGEAHELVGAAIYLASPAASYVTGHVLAVDGGYLACGVPADPPAIA